MVLDRTVEETLGVVYESSAEASSVEDTGLTFYTDPTLERVGLGVVKRVVV